jgi:hypothetical protein
MTHSGSIRPHSGNIRPHSENIRPHSGEALGAAGQPLQRVIQQTNSAYWVIQQTNSANNGPHTPRRLSAGHIWGTANILSFKSKSPVLCQYLTQDYVCILTRKQTVRSWDFISGTFRGNFHCYYLVTLFLHFYYTLYGIDWPRANGFPQLPSTCVWL